MTDEKLSPPAAPATGSAALANVLEESLKRDKARKFRKGDRVHGRVYKLTDSMAFVDLGGAEGLLDLTDLRRSDGTLDLEEGTQIEGIVVDVAANGVLLKRALVPVTESISQLQAAMAAGLPVNAKVTGFNKGGLELDLFGLRGFCPASQVDVRKVDDLSSLVGETFVFRLQEVSSDGKKIVLSRRALLQEDHDKLLAEAKAKIVVGATLTGKVVRVQPFGAFVDLGGGIEGLCHVTELTRARIHDAGEAVKVGDDIQVTVLKLEDTTDKTGRKVERIALSHKGFEQDPWADVTSRFKVGDKVSGKIARLQAFGAFIEVAPGIDGLAHISTLSDKRIEHPREAVKEGDLVEAWILAVEPEKQRLSLSLKEPKKAAPPREREQPREPAGERVIKRFDPASRRPQAAAGEKPRAPRPPREPQAEGAPGEQKPAYRVGTVVDGVVEKVEPFGVFLKLPGDVRALVPNNELGVVKNADQKIDYRKYFSAGAVVRVAITETGARGLKASKVEAERADERAMVKEWSQTQSSTQKKDGGGKGGFGTFADLLKKANIVK